MLTASATRNNSNLEVFRFQSEAASITLNDFAARGSSETVPAHEVQIEGSATSHQSDWVTTVRYNSYGTVYTLFVYGRPSGEFLRSIAALRDLTGSKPRFEYRVTSWGKCLKADNWMGL